MTNYQNAKTNSLEIVELSQETMEKLTGGINPWAAAGIAVEVWDFGFTLGTAIDEATGASDAISKGLYETFG